MADPLTKEDLYGTSQQSASEVAPGVIPETQSVPETMTADGTVSSLPTDLPIEETPEIPMDEHTVKTESAEPVPPKESLPPVGYLPQQRKRSAAGSFGLFILFLLLFAGGIWLSSYVRQYLPGTTDIPFLSGKPKSTPTPTLGTVSLIAPTATTSSVWKTYQVTSGITKRPISGISLQLPSDILSPICDGGNCASQGTYLPGGTRFTIAPRGAGQVLPDFRGSAISDVNGVSFTSKPVTIAGVSATEFTGIFTGRTVSGYAFTKMRGVMIPVTETLSLELNHFTPNGITADFAADDVLFDRILNTVVITTVASGEKGAVLTSVTPTPVRTSTPSPTVSKTPTATVTVSLTRTPTPTPAY
jgi:hypothetical protein